MNNLYEHLFLYIMETTYGKLYAQEKYQRAKAAREAAEGALRAALTAEQRKLLEDFLTKNTVQAGLEEKHLFTETMAILPALLFPA